MVMTKEDAARYHKQMNTGNPSNPVAPKEKEETRSKYFYEAMQIVNDTCMKKNADYANESDFFSNFIESARSANIEVWQSFEHIIGIKEARIRNLQGREHDPVNEPLLESYKDRAVFAVLAFAYMIRSDSDMTRNVEHNI